MNENNSFIKLLVIGLIASYASTQTPLDCNFDANTKCDWVDDVSADLVWKLNKGSTGKCLTHEFTS
jgi:hypothetical protein